MAQNHRVDGYGIEHSDGVAHGVFDVGVFNTVLAGGPGHIIARLR